MLSTVLDIFIDDVSYIYIINVFIICLQGQEVEFWIQEKLDILNS
jgi:hypothetical protein